MTSRSKLVVATRLCLPFVALLCPAPPPANAELLVESRTLVRYFERDDEQGKSQTVLPIYEYLGVDWGELEDKGLSAHFYGWGRHDFGDDFYDDASAGEVLNLYLQYTRDENNVLLRIGRQYVFEGVSNESVDGIRFGREVTDYFSAMVYAGSPVAVEEVDGRGGDWIVGGRVAHHRGTLYDVGLSYKRLDNDGSRAVEDVGVDSVLRLWGYATFNGNSVLSLVADDFKEHSYDARVPLGSFLLRALYEYYDYPALFDAGDRGSSPFIPLAESNQRLSVAGGEVTWLVSDSLDAIVGTKRYDYRDRQGAAWYQSGRISYRWTESAHVGGELGWMRGDEDDLRYTLTRAYVYWPLASGFVSGDAVYVRYDEEILGEDQSTFASASYGRRFLDEALELSFSGDYSSDPYFDKDFRALLVANYKFAR